MILQALLILLVAALALLAINSMRVREIAIAAVRRHCSQQGLQLLDQSVSFRAIKPVRRSSGAITLLRRYTFDFTSTGEERYQGVITMHGMAPARVGLAAHRSPDQSDVGNGQP